MTLALSISQSPHVMPVSPFQNAFVDVDVVMPIKKNAHENDCYWRPWQCAHDHTMNWEKQKYRIQAWTVCNVRIGDTKWERRLLYMLASPTSGQSTGIVESTFLLQSTCITPTLTLTLHTGSACTSILTFIQKLKHSNYGRLNRTFADLLFDELLGSHIFKLWQGCTWYITKTHEKDKTFGFTKISSQMAISVILKTCTIAS